jgi:anti-sigma B factor antagonist
VSGFWIPAGWGPWAGQALELAGLTGAVERVFRLTRMDRMFTIHAGVDDALRATA